MKRVCLWLCLFSLRTHAATADLKLVPLKPRKPRNTLAIGKLSASLWDRDTGELLAERRRDFGDCARCARGVALDGYLGLRLEGDELSSLRLEKKANPKVALKNCAQGADQHTQSVTCEFRLRDLDYKLTVRVE